MQPNLWLKTYFKRYMMEKTQIRRQIKLATRALSVVQCHEQSQRVIAQLREIIAQRKPRVVALFAPLSDEVQIGELNKLPDCRVVLPRVSGDDMEFYELASSSLTEGAYGILEPQGSVSCCADEIDLMVVPGVAFTAAGDRLGRGKGYYDKYLSRKGFRAFCVGVCYAHQLLAELPTESHDKRMDMIVCGNEE